MTKSNKMKLAIITALLCMMMLPICVCSMTTYAATAPDGAYTVNYYDADGELIKTESLNVGDNLTGLDGYDGVYNVRSSNYTELSKYLSFTIPDTSYMNNYLFQGYNDTFYLVDKSIDITKTIIPETGYPEFTDNKIYEQYSLGRYGTETRMYIFNINLNNTFGTHYDYTNAIVKYNNKTITNNVIDGREVYMLSQIYTDATLSGVDHMIHLYNSLENNIGKLVKLNKLTLADGTILYVDDNISSDEITTTEVSTVVSDSSNVINVYTTYEQSITPPVPQDPTTPSPNTPSGTLSGHEANIQALKTQWNALLQGDFKTASGWQLISTATAVAVASVALIVLIWICAVKLHKMNRKAQFSHKKRR